MKLLIFTLCVVRSYWEFLSSNDMMDVHFGDTLWLLHGAAAYGAMCRSGRMV